MSRKTLLYINVLIIGHMYRKHFPKSEHEYFGVCVLNITVKSDDAKSQFLSPLWQLLVSGVLGEASSTAQ